MSADLVLTNLDDLLFLGEAPPAPVEASPNRRFVRLSKRPANSPDIRIASSFQRGFALIASIAMALATLALIPFASVSWGRTDAFLPAYQPAVIATCLITAYLMYGQYSATRYRAILHLSAGYLYTAGILLLQLFSFPGSLVEHRQLLGGSQTAIWLWCFWHLGPALSISLFSWSELRHSGLRTTNHAAAVIRTAVVLLSAWIATALLVTVFHDRLPMLDSGGDFSRMTSIGIAPAIELILAATLAVLWKASGFRNVLHVWLAIVLVALLCDNAITMAAGSRLTMGWYLGRCGALIAFSVLTVVYLQEITASYRRSVEMANQLASSNLQLDGDLDAREEYEEKLREADRRKDDFLAMLAHELRNPLAPISAAADLLKLGKLDAVRVRQTSELIGRQVKHMTSLVDDLLDVSRVTRGLVDLRKAPVDVRDIVRDAVEQVNPLLVSRRHHLTMQLPPGIAVVIGDQKRLVQVMGNLLTNAAKYTPEGGNIFFKVEVVPGQVALTVEDDGIGMAPDLVGRAFDLFAQAERTSDRSSGGLGLGLALVKSLVELHGGNVCCTSKGLGKGSRFIVCLPLASADAGLHPGRNPAALLRPVKPLKILLVDDNVDAAEMLSMFLEASGHEIIVEHGSRRALERAQIELPDLCLLDIGLPEMDGNELAQRLRGISGTAKMVLIAVTGYGQDSDRAASLAAGFDHHMVKPIDLDRLATVLAGIRVA